MRRILACGLFLFGASLQHYFKKREFVRTHLTSQFSYLLCLNALSVRSSSVRVRTCTFDPAVKFPHLPKRVLRAFLIRFGCRCNSEVAADIDARLLSR